MKITTKRYSRRFISRLWLYWLKRTIQSTWWSSKITLWFGEWVRVRWEWSLSARFFSLLFKQLLKTRLKITHRHSSRRFWKLSDILLNHIKSVLTTNWSLMKIMSPSSPYVIIMDRSCVIKLLLKTLLRKSTKSKIIPSFLILSQKKSKILSFFRLMKLIKVKYQVESSVGASIAENKPIFIVKSIVSRFAPLIAKIKV